LVNGLGEDPMKNIRRHLTYATLALVVALSGSAYAANLITSRQIKNGTIQNADIHRNAIKSNKIHNGTIQTADLAPSAQTQVFEASQASVLISYRLDLPKVTQLDIPSAGHYVLSAFPNVYNADLANPNNVTCTLYPGDGGTPDVGYASVGSASSETDISTIALQLVHTYTGPATAFIKCSIFADVSGVNPVQINGVTLTAMRVASVTTP
jgi:hypothetical protein